MKTYFTQHRILIWLIIILLIVNISAIITILYSINARNEYRDLKQFPSGKVYAGSRGVRLCIDSMKLDESQHQHFRTTKHKFYREAKKITGQMHDKRVAFINELASEKPDTLRIQEIAQEIGSLHAELKYQTYKHFIEMKSVCTKEQKKILMQHFKSMLFDDPFLPEKKRHGKVKKMPHHRR